MRLLLSPIHKTTSKPLVATAKAAVQEDAGVSNEGLLAHQNVTGELATCKNQPCSSTKPTALKKPVIRVCVYKQIGNSLCS